MAKTTLSKLFGHGASFAKVKALQKKLNAGSGRVLSKKEQRSKMSDWPKVGEKRTTDTGKKTYRGHNIKFNF